MVKLINGRIGRSGYICTVLICSISLSLVDAISRGKMQGPIGYIIWLLVLIILCVNLYIGAKRCHDLGHNGFWQFIPFYSLWMLIAKGDEEDNEYGEAD